MVGGGGPYDAYAGRPGAVGVDGNVLRRRGVVTGEEGSCARVRTQHKQDGEGVTTAFANAY